MMMLLPPGLFDREGKERFHIGCCPSRAAVGDELVILDFNLDREFAVPSGFVDLLVMELEPFIIGVGSVRADFCTERGVFLLRKDEERKDHLGLHHRDLSVCETDNCLEITKAAIEAGIDAFVEHDPRFEGEEEAVVRIFRAMVLKSLK
jgi:hypothetical protein